MVTDEEKKMLIPKKKKQMRERKCVIVTVNRSISKFYLIASLLLNIKGATSKDKGLQLFPRVS